jgi:hypothetical protein
MAGIKFVDVLGNEHTVPRHGHVFREKMIKNHELQHWLRHDTIDGWSSFYDGRVWQPVSEKENQFSATHLWRIIKMERIEKTMDQKLLKAIEKGKDLEPTFILHDPETYNYEISKLSFLNSWLVARTTKEPDEMKTNFDEEHYVIVQMRYYPEEFEPLFDGRVWCPGGIADRKVSAGRILQIIKKEDIEDKVDQGLLKRIQDGDKIDGNIYVHDYESFNYEGSSSFDHKSYMRTIQSLPKLDRSNWY